MTKAKEYREQKVEELEATLEDLRKSLFDLRCELRTHKKLDQPHLISATKKDIARLLTVISEKKEESLN